MGFHRVTSTNPNTNIEPTYYPGVDTEVFVGGEAVYLTALGFITKGVTGTGLLGYVETRDPVTGDEASLIAVVSDSGATWEVEDGGLAAALLIPGLKVDLNAAGTGIVALTNGDFIIVDHLVLPKTDKVWLKPVTWQIP